MASVAAEGRTKAGRLGWDGDTALDFGSAGGTGSLNAHGAAHKPKLVAVRGLG